VNSVVNVLAVNAIFGSNLLEHGPTFVLRSRRLCIGLYVRNCWSDKTFLFFVVYRAARLPVNPLVVFPAWLRFAPLGFASLRLVWLRLAWFGLAWFRLTSLRLASLGFAWLRLAWLALVWLGSVSLGLASLGHREPVYR
jgi:hypothetical protein